MYKCYPDAAAAIFRTQVGYCEKASNANLQEWTVNAGTKNYTKYAEDMDSLHFYNLGNSIKQGAEWCTVSAAWVLWKTLGGENDPELLKKLKYVMCVPEGVENLSAGAVYWKKYFEDAGRFDQNPQIGDIVFFTTSSARSADHVGMVTDIGTVSGKIYTTEGNKDNKVSECAYPKGYSTILGYGHPRYDVATDSAELQAIKESLSKEQKKSSDLANTNTKLAKKITNALAALA